MQEFILQCNISGVILLINGRAWAFGLFSAPARGR
jgi:hypothetical protein